MASAVETLCGQAYGAHKYDMLGIYLQRVGLTWRFTRVKFEWWITALAQFAYIVWSPQCRLTWAGFSWKAFSGLPDLFKLSAASAVMLCLETWYFQILVRIAAGLLPKPEIALDSLAICMTVYGCVFMVSAGFNVAASYIFTEGEEVSRAVSNMTPLLAATLILNGVQPVLSGVAIGCGWQAFVAYVNVGCYYFVGIPLGCLLGFYFQFGASDKLNRSNFLDWFRKLRIVLKADNKLYVIEEAYLEEPEQGATRAA
ncbi:hypothetical protein LUZ60_006124 [Juncus effusus]|nr:hypothetical protein LUZ60_006124 [Juncus effusus]